MERVIKSTLVALCVTLLFAGLAFGQVSAGDSLYTIKASGWPAVTMEVEIQDATYPFDGSELTVPFTLKGVEGTVYMAIYTDWGQSLDLGNTYKGGRMDVVTRVVGLDTMVYVSPGRQYTPGSHTVSWAGVDYHGNKVEAGNYVYYVFGVGETSHPTWIAYTNGGTSGGMIDFRSEPPVIWWNQGGELGKATIGTDFIANPTAFETFDAKEVIPGLSSIAMEPKEEQVFYGTVVTGEISGVHKFMLTEGGTVDKVSGFADDGLLSVSARAYSVTMFDMPWHRIPPEEDDGIGYLGHMGRGDSPMTSEMVYFDRESGEVAELLDMSDLWVHEVPEMKDDKPTGNMLQSSWIPTWHDTDKNGLWLSGHNADNQSLLDFEANIIWINDFGDAFGDVYDPERDHRTLYVYHSRVYSPYKLSMHTGGGMPYMGWVNGTDGQGLFYITLQNTPYIWNRNIYYMPPESDPRLAGILYVSTGQKMFGEGLPGNTLLHIPYDVAKAALTSGTGTAVEEVEALGTPAEYALDQNYPNPFNPETTIQFAIPDRGSVHAIVQVYNLSGQLVNTLVNDVLEAGHYETAWDGTDSKGMEVSSGVYFYMLKAGDFVSSKKMTLLR